MVDSFNCIFSHLRSVNFKKKINYGRLFKIILPKYVSSIYQWAKITYWFSLKIVLFRILTQCININKQEITAVCQMLVFENSIVFYIKVLKMIWFSGKSLWKCYPFGPKVLIVLEIIVYEPCYIKDICLTSCVRSYFIGIGTLL